MKKLILIIFIFISLASSAQYYTNLGRNKVTADSLFVQHYFIYKGDTVLFPTYTSGRGYQIKNVDDPTDSLDAVNLRTMIDSIASHYDSISIDEGYFVRWSNSVRIDSVLLPSGMLDSVFVNITTDTLFIGGDTIISVAKYAGGGSENFIVASKAYVDSTAAAGGTYTDEQAQDAIGNILSDSGGIDFAYNDGVPSITASYTETDPIYASDSSNVVMFGDTINKIATKKDIESIHDPVTFAGTPDYITLSGQQITRNQIDLTTDVTGVLPDANVANNITLDNVTQITNRSHTSLSNIGINTHAQIDTHLGSTSNPHSVTAAQTNITDPGDYYSSTNTNAVLQEIGPKLVRTGNHVTNDLDTIIGNEYQQIDTFEIASNVIKLSLSNDGEPYKSITLTDNSQTYQSLSGTSISFNTDNGWSANITLPETTCTITFSNLVAGQSGDFTLICGTAAIDILLSGGYDFRISQSVWQGVGDYVSTSGGSAIDGLSWRYDGSRVIINGNGDYK